MIKLILDVTPSDADATAETVETCGGEVLKHIKIDGHTLLGVEVSGERWIPFWTSFTLTRLGQRAKIMLGTEKDLTVIPKPS